MNAACTLLPLLRFQTMRWHKCLTTNVKNFYEWYESHVLGIQFDQKLNYYFFSKKRAKSVDSPRCSNISTCNGMCSTVIQTPRITPQSVDSASNFDKWCLHSRNLVYKLVAYEGRNLNFKICTDILNEGLIILFNIYNLLTL